MKRYETMSNHEIMSIFNSPSLCKDDSCSECYIYKQRENGKLKENICDSDIGTCSDIIKKYLNEELQEESHWHYLKDDDYPTPSSEVIIAYCYDLGDTERYITTVATYEAVFGYPIWIVGNEKWTFDVKAWMSLPEYEEIK